MTTPTLCPTCGRRPSERGCGGGHIRHSATNPAPRPDPIHDLADRCEAMRDALEKCPPALYLYEHWLFREGDKKGAASIKAIAEQARAALSRGEEVSDG